MSGQCSCLDDADVWTMLMSGARVLKFGNNVKKFETCCGNKIVSNPFIFLHLYVALAPGKVQAMSHWHMARFRLCRTGTW